MRPAGTFTPGQPSAFQGHVYGQAPTTTLSVSQFERPSIAPTGSGGCAVVGVSTTSKRRKIAPTCQRIGASSARASPTSGATSTRASRALSRVRSSSCEGSSISASHGVRPADRARQHAGAEDPVRRDRRARRRGPRRSSVAASRSTAARTPRSSRAGRDAEGDLERQRDPQRAPGVRPLGGRARTARAAAAGDRSPRGGCRRLRRAARAASSTVRASGPTHVRPLKESR